MITNAKLTELVIDWMNAWNSRDIYRLMNHYHSNIELDIPGAPETIKGKDAAQKYFLATFKDTSHLTLTFIGVLAGVHGVILVYRRGAYGLAADSISLDENGKMLRG